MTIDERTVAIIRDGIGSQILLMAKMQAEVEALRVVNETLRQKVAELEVKEAVWHKPSPTV